MYGYDEKPDPREYREDICFICNNAFSNLTYDGVCSTCNSLYGTTVDDTGREYDDYIRRYLNVKKETE